MADQEEVSQNPRLVIAAWLSEDKECVHVDVRASVKTCLTECPAAASSGLTYAPTDTMDEVVPPGAPTEDRAGPELPAELTNMTPCLFTTCTTLLVQ